MFMLPDWLHKATGKTLKGPAVTNTQHTLEEEAYRDGMTGGFMKTHRDDKTIDKERERPAKNCKKLCSWCGRLMEANLFLGCTIRFLIGC